MKRASLSITILGVLAGAVYFVSASTLRAGTSTATPSPAFLAAALHNQESACGPSLEVEYTGEWQKVGSVAPEDHEVANYKYSRTPAALRVDKTKADGSRDFASYDRETGEFRRLFAVGGDVGSGEVSEGLMTCFSTPEFFDPVRYPLAEGPLCDRVAYGSVGENMENIDGHDCWRVEIPTQKRGMEKYVAWLDPGIGFCPRRITFAWTDMQPEIVGFADYADLGDGVWFPKKQTVSYGSITRKGATFTIVNEAGKVTDGRVIPKGDVILTFSSGTPVIDTKRDAEYIMP